MCKETLAEYHLIIMYKSYRSNSSAGIWNIVNNTAGIEGL